MHADNISLMEALHTQHNRIAALSLAATLLVAACGTANVPAQRNMNEPAATRTSADATFTYGVTIDRVDDAATTVRALGELPYDTTVRIVYDERVPAMHYQEFTEQIASTSTVMGEILDSLYVPEYTLEAYAERTREYVTTLGDDVDIWEIGNEVNGEWLVGPNETPDDVAKKVNTAYEIVRDHGGKTALTLYYNEPCAEQPEHEMFTWVNDHVNESMRQNLDYVLVSYYEEDCAGQIDNWQEVFTQLRILFPSARLGFGETGTESTSTERQKEMISRYYGYDIDVEGYIGGVFWWYFWRDVVEPYGRGDTEMLRFFQDLR